MHHCRKITRQRTVRKKNYTNIPLWSSDRRNTKSLQEDLEVSVTRDDSILSDLVGEIKFY